MKKIYQTPMMTEVLLQHTSLICQIITSIENNVGINYGGGSSTEDARVKQCDYNVWDDVW